MRYAGNLTDGEWALNGLLIQQAKRGGNKRSVVEREIVNGIMYIPATEYQCAALPKRPPRRSTPNHYLRLWTADGTLGRIDSAGYEAGKKIKGKQRHLLVDTQGLLGRAIVHAVDIRDRDGGLLLTGELFDFM